MNFEELDLIILKTLISNKKNALDFANECDTKLFSPELWTAANIVVGYVKTYKEIPTLRVITEKLAKGNNEKLVDYIKTVWEKLDTIEYDNKEYKHDLEKMKRRFAERQISEIKTKLSKIDIGTMDLGKTVTDIQKTVKSIISINSSKAYEAKNVKDYLPTFVEQFKAKKENPNFDPGLMTGYSFFDFATNGIKPADLILIAGESGFGKSLFLNNLGIQVWLQNNSIKNSDNFSPGKNVVYFSLEMPYEDCFNRFLSRLSGVPTRKIEDPSQICKEEFIRIRAALDFINKYPYQFNIIDIADACANDLDLILSDCDKDYDAIFIDYLGIMKPNEKSDEADWLKQGIIAYEIRAIGRRRNKPIFSAVQLNRKSQGKDSSENIGLSRLARSGTIATHATHVIQIESRNQEEKYPDFLYHFIKNRKGPKGRGILIKNLACATLLDKPIEINKTEDNCSNSDDISKELENINI